MPKKKKKKIGTGKSRMKARRRQERREGGTGMAAVLTFGGCQHGRGQLTLAGFKVAENEPAGEAVAHHGVQWVGMRLSSWKCCLQHGEPGVRGKRAEGEEGLLSLAGEATAPA
jgi:hypothetical protein